MVYDATLPVFLELLLQPAVCLRSSFPGSRVSCNFIFLRCNFYFFLDVTSSFCEGPKEQTPQEPLAEDDNPKE